MKNVYYSAWQEGRNIYTRNFAPGNNQQRRMNSTARKVKPLLYQRAYHILDKQMKEKVSLAAIRKASEAAAKSTLTGRTGATVRLVGRVGVRINPYIGAALLAKDLYDLYRWSTD